MKVDFCSEHEREILTEAYRAAVDEQIAHVKDHTPLVVVIHDPRLAAIAKKMQQADDELRRTFPDSNIVQHQLEMGTAFGSMLSQEIRGNTRFVKKAA